MIKEHDRIVLRVDLPAQSLKSGDVGTVVHLYKDRIAYEVEFVSLEGKTLAVATLDAAQVRPVNPNEITHARELSAAEVALDQQKSVAIITGASRGIGHACAEMLDSLGWSLALVARDENDLKKSASKFKRVIIVPADVSESSAPSEIISRAMKEFGRVDALVNNAGSAPMLGVEETSDKIWDDTLAINLTASFRLMRECWPIFRKQKSGVIVNISSVAARDPFPGLIAYGAAKAGLINLGISLAREGAKDNIRVHTIAPAATETKMFRSLPGVESFGPDKTMKPEEVARAIVACITGELAHTSGETIYLRKQL